MTPKPIDPVQVKDLFEYNPKTGEVLYRRRIEKVWKDKRFNERCAGKTALHLSTDHSGRISYVINFNGMSYQAGRVIWAIYHSDDPSSALIDHKDGNQLNNRIDNIRLSNLSGNARNRKTTRRNKSGYLGVYKKNRGGFFFVVMGDNRKREEGSGFLTARDAAIARDIVAKRLHGEFCKSSVEEHDQKLLYASS